MSHSIGAHGDFVPAAVRVPVTDACTPFGPSLECLLNHCTCSMYEFWPTCRMRDTTVSSCQPSIAVTPAQWLAAATNSAIAFLMSVVGENRSERHPEATDPNSPLPLALNLASIGRSTANQNPCCWREAGIKHIMIHRILETAFESRMPPSDCCLVYSSAKDELLPGQSLRQPCPNRVVDPSATSTAVQLSGAIIESLLRTNLELVTVTFSVAQRVGRFLA